MNGQQTLLQPKGVRKTHRKPRPAWHREATAQTRFQESLHEPHWDARATIITALMEASTGYLKAKGLRLASCGCGASFYVEPNGEHVKPWLSRCKDRVCPFCSKARAMSVSDGLLDLMINHECRRMIILTLCADFFPLADGLQRLKQCFKRLRRSPTWRKYVTGGAYVFEITLNLETMGWHPHLHIAYRGDYFPQKLLRSLWEKITGDSFVVWVTKINDAKGAAQEMSKYIGKPQRIEEFPAERIREYAQATKGLRMVQTFGDCHNKEVSDEDPGVEKKTTDRHITLSELIHLARQGHESPAHLLRLVAKRWQVFGRYISHELPILVADTGREDHAAALLRLLRAEGPEKPRPPPGAVDVNRLDEKIRTAFFAYLADEHRGAFDNTVMYYTTGTEYLERTR